ncbi:hypothetical protein [Isoptericola sediminis]|uniref:Uncharacterized protein n=1 Tax=Isoptericola sediminis TaxID=2733572 RepID=A0A849JU74_9MICO|nr:hypothetical protein [Isoptericola sediminis]NNU26936.1 hypothetical protein [Isoptericola sediminis]
MTPLPAEVRATPEELDTIEGLLEAIEKPVTDEEAQALLGAFGPDGCFGFGWFVLHLIETAPGAASVDYSRNSENDWVRLLEERRGWCRSAGSGSPS